ncbi:VOC family protein [Cellulomonas massiliensis]|uniref:VOC family protein n=1 Tax=Cellulomonas massiliensis TaxID=1465811 RepID=UPI0002E60E91|nr:VOC family protein [Cellulomonas massiliensis]
MAVEFQVTFDAHDPRALGEFWAQVLGYRSQDPPAGFGTWEEFLEHVGVPPEERDSAWAVIDPEGVGPRLFFQRVPEGKTAKNRVHLDVNVAAAVEAPQRPELVRARARELVALGARQVDEREKMGEFWVVMTDPEGNEFCLQ